MALLALLLCYSGLCERRAGKGLETSHGSWDVLDLDVIHLETYTTAVEIPVRASMNEFECTPRDCKLASEAHEPSSTGFVESGREQASHVIDSPAYSPLAWNNRRLQCPDPWVPYPV